MKSKKTSLAIKDITLIGMMVAVIEVCKLALAWAANIELVSFLFIMFTLFFGKKVAFVVPVFILIEGCVYGVGDWWFIYLYVWPILVLITWVFRKQDSVWFWCVVSSLFGFAFGFLCSFTYVIIGAVDGGIRSGLTVGFAKWVSGIPFDIPHGVGNFVIMMVLYHPVRKVLKEASKLYD